MEIVSGGPALAAVEWLAGQADAKAGFDPVWTSVAELGRLKQALPGKLRRGFLKPLETPLVEPLRLVKDADELALMSEAARVGCGLFEHMLGFIRPGLREIAQRHPSVGEVRGIGAFWALDLVKDRETREMLVPYGAAGAAAAPMNAVLAACKANGVMPFANYNRLQITPPLNLSDEDARRGLAGIDKALSVADEYAAG